MLSSKFISPSVYNSLPDINDTAVIPDGTLRALGHLFAVFKFEQIVGVDLLQKYFELAQDTVMVHKGFICKPEPIQVSASTTGTSVFQDGTDFQAFESVQEEPLTLPNDFLDAFANHLEAHQLSSKVALSKLDMKSPIMPDHEVASGSGRTLLMEHLDPPTNSHIIEEIPQILPRETTQWIFEEVQGAR